MTPPQHAKSLITSRLFPSIALAQNPEHKLMLLSYGTDLASGHGSVARDYCLEFAHQLDPSGRLQIRKDTKSKSNWRTSVDGGLYSASIQGTVTGRSATGIIIDDPFKGSEDSGSVRIRDKVWDTYSAAVETRLTPDGFVVLINTPWHPDDLTGRLLTNEPEKWIVLRFPALAEDGDFLGRPVGEGLFLSKYSQGWYEEKKRDYELRGQSHIWDALYQCGPTGDPSLRAFPDSYFGDWMWVDDIPASQDNHVVCRGLALDPSKSKTGKTGDYAAFAAVTLLRNGHLYFTMDLSRAPLTTLYERAETVVRASIDEQRQFTAGFAVETNMFQEAVAQAIDERLRKANLPVDLKYYHTSSDQSKHARIRNSFDQLLAKKRVHFVGKTTSNKLTLQQLKEIPNGAHDDGPDGMDLARQLCNEFLTGVRKTPATVLRV